MNRLFLLLTIPFIGCTTLTYPQRAQILNTELKIYLANPGNDVFFVVDTTDQRLGVPLQCQSNANSFQKSTPHFGRVPTSELQESIELLMSKASESEKPLVMAKIQNLLNSAAFNLICQNQSQHIGIYGKMYFKGKEIASSNAQVPYGIVTLTYTLKPEDFIN